MEEKSREQVQKSLPKNCFYLCGSGITIEGLKFWGVPFFFAIDDNSDYLKMIGQIPLDTDTLITHRPPRGILDNAGKVNYGCSDLLSIVLDIRPKYNFFGHIHDTYGVVETEHTTFVNASVVDKDYHLANRPFEFEI